MRTDNYFDSNRDLTFYYEKVIDWDRLVPLYAEPDDAMRPAETAAIIEEFLAGEGASLEPESGLLSRAVSQARRLFPI